MGKDYGTDALSLMINYGFDTLNLHRIELEGFASNPRALACYKKVGFRQEGIRKQAIFKRNQFIDSIIMGLLKNDWN